MKFEPDEITKKVKPIVQRYDADATVILFGSRARGDWWEESDWDFLILTDKAAIIELSDFEKNIRNDIFDEIEMGTFDSVQTIVRNRKLWEEKHWVTDLYESIKEEGIVV